MQKELTSPEAIARYVRHVVDALRRAQAQHLIKWGDVLAGENCSDFVEVTVDGAPAHAHHLWFYQNASDVANTSARVGMHYTSNVYAPVASCAAMVGAAVKTRDTSSHGASGRTDKPEAVGARVGAAPALAGPGRALVRVDVRAEVVVRDGPGFLVKLRPVAAALPPHDGIERGINCSM